MAITTFAQWSSTAASNTDLNDLPLGTNQTLPSHLNNLFQEMMAQLTTAFNSGATVTFGGITITSTDAGAAAGPEIVLYRNSATPAPSDVIGKVRWDGEDSAGNTQEYANFFATISDATSGSEDSFLTAQVIIAGTLTNVFLISSGGASFGSSVAASGYGLTRPIGTGTFSVSGGGTSGGQLVFYGNAHATKAGDIEMNSDATGPVFNVYSYDFSARTHTFHDQLIGDGTATNDSASAGQIGEYISSAVASGSSVSLTTDTAANVTSISLTAGDWDVSGFVAFDNGATTSITRLAASISQVSATSDFTTAHAYGSQIAAAFVPGSGGVDITQRAGPLRISLAGTTTIYLVAFATFTVSSLAAYGGIRARRVR